MHGCMYHHPMVMCLDLFVCYYKDILFFQLCRVAYYYSYNYSYYFYFFANLSSATGDQCQSSVVHFLAPTFAHLS